MTWRDVVTSLVIGTLVMLGSCQMGFSFGYSAGMCCASYEISLKDTTRDWARVQRTCALRWKPCKWD